MGTICFPEWKPRGKVSLRIVLLRKIPEDSTLQRRWNDLVLQMELPKVFYTCEWALAVHSAYEASLKPLLFLGYEGDDLVGVACLGADPAEQNISFLNATTADYCEFLSHPERRAEFVDKVFAELRQLGAGQSRARQFAGRFGNPRRASNCSKEVWFSPVHSTVILVPSGRAGFGRATSGVENDHHAQATAPPLPEGDGA